MSHGGPHDNDHRIIVEAVQFNGKKIGDYETILFIAGGAIAGILGLTNLRGLVGFMITSIISTIGIAWKARFNTHEYMNTSFINVWINSMSSHAFSFVLFWTLTYALVYIY